MNSFPFLSSPHHALLWSASTHRHLLPHHCLALSHKPGWRNKAALAVAALIGYWILMRFVPVPGYGIPGHDVSPSRPRRQPHRMARPPDLLRLPPVRAHPRPGRPAQHHTCRSNRAHRPAHRHLATHDTQLSAKARGIAIAGLSGVSSRRPLEPLLPHQQEALDQLLRSLRGRSQPAAARSLHHDRRSAQEESSRSGPLSPPHAVSRFRNECHLGLRFFGAPSVDAK